jgi:hypothetical protein
VQLTLFLPTPLQTMQVFDTTVGTSLVTGSVSNAGVSAGMALGETIAVGSAGVHYCWKADIAQDPGFGSSDSAFVKPCCSMTQFHLNASLGMTFSSSAVRENEAIRAPGGRCVCSTRRPPAK